MRYIHDGVNLFIELDGSGNIRAEYTYYPGVDQPHSVRRGGGMYYFALDYPGNVLGLFTGSGALANEYRYSLFGQTVAANETIENPLRYAAREFDVETGLYHFRARYYDPAISRFVSEDPIGLAGGINPYSYANNSPHNFSDPFGLSAQDCPSGMSRAPDGRCGYNLPGIVAAVAGGGPGWMPIFGPRDPSAGWRLAGPGSAKLAGGGGSYGTKVASTGTRQPLVSPTCGGAPLVLGATAIFDGLTSIPLIKGGALLAVGGYRLVRAGAALGHGGNVVEAGVWAMAASRSASQGLAMAVPAAGRRGVGIPAWSTVRAEAGYGGGFNPLALIPGVATGMAAVDAYSACF